MGKVRRHKPGAGKPPIILDDKQLEEILRLCEIQCTDEEIAYALGISVDTLTRNYAEHIKNGKASGRRSLRRRQFEGADKGNATMLVWLGKQVLGQTDKVEQTNYDGDKPKTEAEADKRIEAILARLEKK